MAALSADADGDRLIVAAPAVDLASAAPVGERMSDSDDTIPLADPDDLIPPSPAAGGPMPLDEAEADDDAAPTPSRPRRPALPPVQPGKPLPRISRTAPLSEAEARDREDAALPPSRRSRSAEEPMSKAGKKDRDEAPADRPARKKDRSWAHDDGDRPARSRSAEPRARSRPGKSYDDAKDEKKKSVLKEETPELDTYESRQKFRLIVGFAAVGLIGLVILFIVRGVSGGGAADSEEGTPMVLEPGFPGGPGPSGAAPPAPSRPNPAIAENEANLLLADARGFAEAGNETATDERLRKILKQYEKTRAAAQAREALDRRSRGLPFFIDGPAVVAERVPTKAGPAPTMVVEVQPPPAIQADVRVIAPDQPPEPYVTTNLPIERAEVAPLPLPPGFRPRHEAGVHPSGWPNEITCDRDGAAMVLIPGGVFQMGRDDGSNPEGPAHNVSLSPYYIDQHETTVGQFRLYLERTHQSLDGVPALKSNPADNLPVVLVSQGEAAAYARWAGKALPTEAQWEFAARTIDNRVHPWGNDPAQWVKPRQPRQIDPVLSFPGDLSPYGVFDLAGNAWEWTADFYDSRYYRQFQNASATNPTGPDRSASRPPQATIRGSAKDWRSSHREGMPIETRLPYLGFRCVLPLNAAAPPVAAPDPGTPPKPGQPMPPAGRPNNNAGAVPF